MEKQLKLTTHIDEISRLPLFVDELKSELSLNEEQVFYLNLALEEAVTNVVNYAYTDQQTHEFTLDSLDEDDMLTFVLTDDGQPFDPTEVPPIDTTQSADERKIGGLGIFLINKVMDEVKYKRQDDKNILTLKKRIR